MNRFDIINKVGSEYLTENIENGEFSYVKALGRPMTGHYKLDLRFESPKGYSIIIETKKNKTNN